MMTVRRMRFVCWITTATDTLSEYVIIIACLLQQYLHERTSMLHYGTVTPLFCFFLTVNHSIDLFHLPTLMHNSFIH